ncbi:MAG: hypothetical protein OQL11_06515 [Gammaproteobacteria bacterium]|nr:hypothetical protein [Gammaproteobacteria bacterium]
MSIELTGWTHERWEQGPRFSGLTAANTIPYDPWQNTAAKGLATDRG